MSFGDTNISFSHIANIIDKRAPGPGTAISMSSFRNKMKISDSVPISIETHFKGKKFFEFLGTSVSLYSIYNHNHNSLKVLSIENTGGSIGRYFNFNRDESFYYQGDTHMYARHIRNGVEQWDGSVKLYTVPAGGSVGDSYGHKHVAQNEIDDWDDRPEWGLYWVPQHASWNFDDLQQATKDSDGNVTTTQIGGSVNNIMSIKTNNYDYSQGMGRVDQSWGDYDYPTFPIRGGHWANGSTAAKILSTLPIDIIQPSKKLSGSSYDKSRSNYYYYNDPDDKVRVNDVYNYLLSGYIKCNKDGNYYFGAKIYRYPRILILVKDLNETNNKVWHFPSSYTLYRTDAIPMKKGHWYELHIIVQGSGYYYYQGSGFQLGWSDNTRVPTDYYSEIGYTNGTWRLYPSSDIGGITHWETRFGWIAEDSPLQFIKEYNPDEWWLPNDKLIIGQEGVTITAENGAKDTHYAYTNINNIELKPTNFGFINNNQWYFKINVPELINGRNYIIQFDYYTTHPSAAKFQWRFNNGAPNTLTATPFIQKSKIEIQKENNFHFYIRKNDVTPVSSIYIKNFSVALHRPGSSYSYFTKSRWIAVENGGNKASCDENTHLPLLPGFLDNDGNVYSLPLSKFKVNGITGGWAYEMSFKVGRTEGSGDIYSFVGTSNNTIFQLGEFDMALGTTIYFSSQDSYGDGWNNGYFIIYQYVNGEWVQLTDAGGKAIGKGKSELSWGVVTGKNSANKNTYFVPLATGVNHARIQHDPQITWDDGAFQNINSATTIFFENKINPTINYVGIELTLNENVDGWIALTDIDKSWPDYPQWNSDTKTYGNEVNPWHNDGKWSYNVGVYNSNISIHFWWKNRTPNDGNKIGNTNRTTLQEGDSIRLVVHNDNDTNSYIRVYSKAKNTNEWVKNHQFAHTGKSYNYDWAISYTTSNMASKDDIRLVTKVNDIYGEWLYFKFDNDVFLNKIVIKSQNSWSTRNARVISLVASNEEITQYSNKAIVSNFVGYPSEYSQLGIFDVKKYKGEYMVFDFRRHIKEIKGNTKYKYWGIVIQGLVGKNLGESGDVAGVTNIEYIHFYDGNNELIPSSNITLQGYSSEYNTTTGKANNILNNDGTAWENKNDGHVYNGVTGYYDKTINSNKYLTINSTL
jgi:hypothetical protein